MTLPRLALHVAFTNGRPSPGPEDRTALFESVPKTYFDSFKLLPASTARR